MELLQQRAQLPIQQRFANAKPLTPRRHYPTLRIKPYRRSPLKRLQWIFEFVVA